MRPGLWWWHCCWAQRLSGVQRLSWSTGGLYSLPTPNLSWEQAFLFNKAPPFPNSHHWDVFFSCFYCFSKKHSWLLPSLKGIKILIQLYFLPFSCDKSIAHVWVLGPESISLHDWHLVRILRVWSWLGKASVLSVVGCNSVFMMRHHLQIRSSCG